MCVLYMNASLPAMASHVHTNDTSNDDEKENTKRNTASTTVAVYYAGHAKTPIVVLDRVLPAAEFASVRWPPGLA